MVQHAPKSSLSPQPAPAEALRTRAQRQLGRARLNPPGVARIAYLSGVWRDHVGRALGRRARLIVPPLHQGGDARSWWWVDLLRKNESRFQEPAQLARQQFAVVSGVQITGDVVVFLCQHLCLCARVR